MSEVMEPVVENDASEIAYEAARNVLVEALAECWVKSTEAENRKKLAEEEVERLWAQYRELGLMLEALTSKKSELERAKP